MDTIIMKMIDLKDTGKAIAIARKERGYTQKQLADKTGTFQQQIARFEAGKLNCTLSLFIAILGALDMHIDLSLKDGDNPTGFMPANKN